jgi:hypothetical protein
MTTKPRQRPGDQPLPVPNSRPSIHDLVLKDLGEGSLHLGEGVSLILAERRQVGLDRYNSVLQAFNQRDTQRDLLEELADAIVYARQLIEEHDESGTPPGPQRVRLDVVYHSLLFLLSDVCTLSLPVPEPRYGDGKQAGEPADGAGS